MDVGITRTEVQVRRRGEWAMVRFDLGDADKDKLPRSVSKLAKETLCLDLYWQPAIGATYWYAEREWEVARIDVFPTKKGSREKKFLPIVVLKLKEG